MPIPKRDELYNPLLQALKRLGGSASIAELDEEVTKSLNLTEAEISQPHSQRYTALEYELAWARTELKKVGLLDTSGRGVWSLTAKGREAGKIDPRQLRREIKQVKIDNQTSAPPAGDVGAHTHGPEVVEASFEQEWEKQLLAIMLKLDPDAFERLCQRLLRESGFTQVRVTGHPGDGGIDGVGIVQLGGLLSFPVVFQCKRYQGSVSAGEIRNFRGAMVGRADRGLFITTGTFTPSARQEATRDGVPLIDLLDGEQLIEKLKELQLGVLVRKIEVEEVTVLPDWFKEI